MRDSISAVLLCLWLDLTSGIMNIQLIPQHPVINESVILSVTGVSERILAFTWFKGPDTSAKNQILTYLPASSPPLLIGQQYNLRVRAVANGSLQITSLLLSDQDNYTVRMQTEKPEQQASVVLPVYEPVSKPVIIASHSEIQENDTVTLTCVSVNAERIIWHRDNAILEEEASISVDKRIITFSKIRRRNEGRYKCEAENLISKSTSDIYTLTILLYMDSYCYSIQFTVKADHREEHKNLLTTEETSSTFLDDNPGYSAQTNTAVTAGIISGTVLGTVLIVSVSFLVYKRCVPPVREEMTGSPSIEQHSYAIYDNMLDLAMNRKSTEEASYMCLQFQSEGIYNELEG